MPQVSWLQQSYFNVTGWCVLCPTFRIMFTEKCSRLCLYVFWWHVNCIICWDCFFEIKILCSCRSRPLRNNRKNRGCIWIYDANGDHLHSLARELQILEIKKTFQHFTGIINNHTEMKTCLFLPKESRKAEDGRPGGPEEALDVGSTERTLSC